MAVPITIIICFCLPVSPTNVGVLYLSNRQSICLSTFSTVTNENSGDCRRAGLSAENLQCQLHYFTVKFFFLIPFRAYRSLLPSFVGFVLSDGVKSWRQ